jgi:hypothetical protein
MCNWKYDYRKTRYKVSRLGALKVENCTMMRFYTPRKGILASSFLMNKDNIDGQKIHCNKIKKELSSVAEVAWGPQHQYQEWGDVAFS